MVRSIEERKGTGPDPVRGQAPIPATAREGHGTREPDFDWGDLEKHVSRERPENSFTTAEFGAKFNYKRSAAQYKIAELVAQGRVKMARKVDGIRYYVLC